MTELGKAMALISAGVLALAGIQTIVRVLQPLRREEEEGPELVMILAGLFMAFTAIALIMIAFDL